MCIYDRYQGLYSTLLRNIFSVSMYFGSFEATKTFIAAHNNKSIQQLNALELLASGGVGGLCYWLLTYPLDVVKSTLQAQPPDYNQRQHKTYISTVKYLYNNGGIKRFTNGYAICCMRAVPANAVCFMLYETTAKYLSSLVSK